jgi:hypothetical protein
MTRESRPNPPRLAERDDAAGRLLGEGADAFGGPVDEARAFHRLERTERGRTRLAWAGGAAGLALVLSFWWGGPRRSGGAVEFAAVPEAVPTVASRVNAPALAVTTTDAERPPVEPSQAPHTGASPPAPAPAEPTEPTEPTEARCRELAQKTSPQRGADCFRSLSRGSGVEAEVALYEAARLSADKLSDHARALELSEEYERRFPSGALRGEIAWLRVRSLRAAGRLDEAFSASERLLDTKAGRALSRDIHWLRGVAYQDERNDCERAASEFVSLIGEPGARGDDAELRRAHCLEQLGRNADARRAYEQYLKRASPLRVSEARARLEALVDTAEASPAR